MNKIEAKIVRIERNNEVALVKLESKSGNIFSVLMLDSASKIAENLPCKAVFKESEVMICHKDYDKISARNRFISRVREIERDEIFARIYFDFKDSLDSTIKALITKEACDVLGVSVGAEFGWFVKSNEVMLEF